MAVRIDLTLDCANPTRLAEFWKLALGYEDEPPPAPFTSREEWLAQFDPDEDDEEDDDGPDLLRVRMTASAARSFVARAAQVVAAGRPPCPLCGAPLDPLGHICPRRNGHYVN